MRQPLRHDTTPFLRSPIVLGALAVIAVAFILVVVVVLLSGGAGGSKTSVVLTKAPTQQKTEDDTNGLTGTAAATINVRSGPGNNYEAIGTLRKGSTVAIVGIDEDGEWLQIQYPAHSRLRGWVVAGSLEVEGDLAQAPIATPDALPLPDVPTSEPSRITPEATAEVTVTPTFTPAPALPDLVASGWLSAAGFLVVTVTNQGAGPLTEVPIEVSVFDAAGTRLLNSVTSAPQTLDGGASIDVKTGFPATPAVPQVLVIIDADGKIPETDDTNNRLPVTFSDAGATPTVTATAHP